MLKHTLKFTAFFFFFTAFSALAQVNPGLTSKGLREKIEFLASDSLKGRKPGMAECDIAARYIRDYFRNCGLTLLCNEGLQGFEVVADVKTGNNNHLIIGDYKAVAGRDFTPLSFSSNGEVSAPVVFAGYGFNLNLDSLRWNDYEGLDVKNKWVMILRGDPEPDNPNTVFLPYEQERAKVITAKDLGAAGVLMVTPTDIEKKDNLMHMQYDKSPADAGIPVINITRELAGKILASMNYAIQDLESSIKANKRPNSVHTPVVLKASSEILPQKVTTYNVIGILPGKIRDEYILIGAHYDHLGLGGPNSGSRTPDEEAIHNGADDNASGTAGIMELAKNLSALKQPLQRSILFVAFTGEEMGLLGSKEFVKHSPVPLSSIKAMINLDMIGRLNTEKVLSIGGTGTSVETDAMLDKLTAKSKLDIRRSPDGYGPSDHASFYSENIPVFFFSTGAHEDYHTPEDDAGKINYQGMVEVLALTEKLAIELANRIQPLTFRESGAKAGMRYGRNMKVTLGIVPDMVSSENNGLGVDGVRKGGPADTAGIKKGDRIVAINGQAVTNIYEYMTRMGQLKPGEVASVEVVRTGKKQIIIVQF